MSELKLRIGQIFGIVIKYNVFIPTMPTKILTLSLRIHYNHYSEYY